MQKTVDNNRNIKKQVSYGQCAWELHGQCCLAAGLGQGWSWLGPEAQGPLVSKEGGMMRAGLGQRGQRLNRGKQWKIKETHGDQLGVGLGKKMGSE